MLLLVLALLVVGAGVASTTVTARAPPEPVCGVCTQALDRAGQDHDVEITRGTSEMTVRVHPNGTATFTARVSLARGAETLRNATLRRAVVRDVGYVTADERRDLRTRIDGRTLVVRYRAAVAHRSLGVIRFDAFETTGAPPLASGGDGPPYPGADTLVVRAPADHRIAGEHGDSTTDTAIVWHGDSDEQYAGHIDAAVISFVPRDATVPAVRVRLAGLLDWLGSLT